MVGCGCEKEPDLFGDSISPDARRLKVAAAKVSTVSKSMFATDASAGGPLACPGDSGGPVYLGDGSSRTVIGVNSNTRGKVTKFARLDSRSLVGVAAWLGRILGAPSDLPVDVAGHPLQADIATALRRGLVKGFPDGTFRPSEGVTRAQMASILVDILEAADPALDVPAARPATAPFTDLPAEHWAAPKVVFARAKPGSFEPGLAATRADAVASTARALGCLTR